MKSLLRVSRYITPYRGLALLTLLCAAGVTLVELLPPWLTKVVIDEVIKPGPPQADMTVLNWVLGGLVSAYLLRALLHAVRIRSNNALEQKVIYDMRSDVYRSLHRLSITYYENRSTGEIMSRVNNDVNNLERIFIDGLEHLVIALFTLLGITTMIFLINWRLAVVALLPLPFLIMGALRYTRRVHELYRLLREKLAEMNIILQDTISGIRETISFHRKEYEIGRFNKKSTGYCETNLTVASLWSFYFPGMTCLGALGLSLVLWYGARQVIEGTLTVGELVAFLSYLALFYTPINQIHSINHMLQHALAAGERVFEVMDAVPEVVEHEGAITLPAKVQGYVLFNGVSFRYRDGIPVLKGITLEASPGETIALVGSSGSGKTTIVHLLMRYYDVKEGNITIDGYDIRRFALSYLRDQIGLVQQEPFLFNGTVRENIAYGDLTAPENRIREAAEAAGCHEFIMNLPYSYDTWVGERGVKLSVGEKQRISIARALLKDPPIIILDEATSSVDAEMESQIQEALRTLTRNRTTFVIAHRLSTLRGADRILVIEEGRIRESGSHTELLQKNGIYSGLFEAQCRL